MSYSSKETNYSGQLEKYIEEIRGLLALADGSPLSAHKRNPTIEYSLGGSPWAIKLTEMIIVQVCVSLEKKVHSEIFFQQIYLIFFPARLGAGRLIRFMNE